MSQINVTIRDELKNGSIITTTEIRREGSKLPITFTYNSTYKQGTKPEDIIRLLELCNINYTSKEIRFKV